MIAKGRTIVYRKVYKEIKLVPRNISMQKLGKLVKDPEFLNRLRDAAKKRIPTMHEKFYNSFHLILRLQAIKCHLVNRLERQLWQNLKD